MATKKRICSELKLGDKFLLPRHAVEIVGTGKIPHCIVSESKGKLLCYRVAYKDGPLAGTEAEVVILGDDKIDYILKEPVAKRLAKSIVSWWKGSPKKKSVTVAVIPFFMKKR